MSKGIERLMLLVLVVVGVVMCTTDKGGAEENVGQMQIQEEILIEARSQEKKINQAWDQVKNQYQRRADLIPNLVNTVKGVADFKKETYIAVTETRAKVNQISMTSDMLSDPQALQKFQTAQDGLGSALSKLLVTVERYPKLRANENFLQLQSQLEGTENKISVKKRNYNQVVQAYNAIIRKFPKGFDSGFVEKYYFKAVAGLEESPKVEF